MKAATPDLFDQRITGSGAMDEDRIQKATKNLLTAALMSADELAAKKGESDLFVRIKRNSERLSACAGHEFEPDPDWRTWKPNRTVHCRRCGGDMKMHDAMEYLRGFAHGSGQDFKVLCAAIWPPAS